MEEATGWGESAAMGKFGGTEDFGSSIKRREESGIRSQELGTKSKFLIHNSYFMLPTFH